MARESRVIGECPGEMLTFAPSSLFGLLCNSLFESNTCVAAVSKLPPTPKNVHKFGAK